MTEVENLWSYPNLKKAEEFVCALYGMKDLKDLDVARCLTSTQICGKLRERVCSRIHNVAHLSRV